MNLTEEMKNTRKTISANIKKVRLKQNLTKKEVAQIANINYYAYLRIENNKNSNPYVYNLIKIARALGIKIADLF